MDDGIRILLDAIEKSGEQNKALRKREIELLTILLEKEETMNALTTMLANKTFPKSEAIKKAGE